MTIDVLIDEFISGKTEGSNVSGKLKISGDKLIHYETVILERYNDSFILNYSRYSMTTGVLQNKIRDKIKDYNYFTLTKVPRGFLGSLVEELERK